MERQLHGRLNESERKASIDGLTRLWTRDAIVGLLCLEADKSALASRPWGVAIVDVDHFKKVNDTFGHATYQRAGDA